MRELLFLVVGAVLASIAFFALDTDTNTTPANQIAAVQATTTLPAENSEKETYRVLKVVDGDTLAIEMDGKSVSVRLIGLDTPETLDPRKPVQCFGKEASDKAKKLLANASVSIEQDVTQGELDKYGRLLAYIFLEDGTLFNKYMIAEGYGHEYTYNLPYRYQSDFKAAEKEARENKKGLWAHNACASESVRESKPAVTPIVPAPSGNYECSRNIYNCTSFKTQTEAQTAFDSCGGSQNDVHKLDSDKDGSVCESLP